MRATSFLRLLPDNDFSWAMMPEFKRRIREFVAKNLPSTDPDSVVYDAVTKWTSMPLTTGYWMAFCEAKPIAHMASWIIESYGKPFVFIYQAEVDKGYNLGGIQADIFADMDRWVQTLNALIPDGRAKILKGELSTWRDAPSMVKYFTATGREAVKDRAVIEFSVGFSHAQAVV